MAIIKFTGIDEYVRKLENLASYTDKLIGEAVYKGADVVANETKQALQSLPVDNSTNKATRTSINQIQKNGLIESFGIAKMRNDNGFLNVKTGFDGYNKLISNSYPTGQPNIMIARALESGTSFMPKNRVISRATNRAKKACEEAMKKSIEGNIEKLMK